MEKMKIKPLVVLAIIIYLSLLVLVFEFRIFLEHSFGFIGRLIGFLFMAAYLLCPAILIDKYGVKKD